MKLVEIVFHNGIVAIVTVPDAYISEGCLWMALDTEGEHVKVIPLTDIVRSDICKLFVQAFEKDVEP